MYIKIRTMVASGTEITLLSKHHHWVSQNESVVASVSAIFRPHMLIFYINIVK